jgi:hypothetical protein
MGPSSLNLHDDVMVALASTCKAVGSQVVLAGIAFKALFDVHYAYQISPSYSYMGMVLSLNYHKLLESYLITLALLLIVGWRPRTPSTMVLIVGLFTGIIPLLSFYALQDRSAAFSYVSALAFVVSLLITCLPRVRVRYLRITPAIFAAICVIVMSTVVCLLLLQGAYQHFTFNLYSVYEYRAELDELAYVGPFRYVTDWAYNVFSIALLVWALHQRSKAAALFAITIQIFMYGCILMKSILFNLPFVILTYYILRRRGSIVGLGWLMCGIVLIGMGEGWLLGYSDMTALITRRVLALPAYLANEYFELFRDIGHVYWTNGLLGSWAPYPFAAEPPRLVGESAMGSLDTWANNGMFGMGFMQAGFLGMLLYGALYGVWLYLIDCIALGRVSVEVAVSMVIVPAAVVVTDTDLLTGLLTHGGIAATLMLWLWGGMVPERRSGYAQAMRLAAQSPTAN